MEMARSLLKAKELPNSFWAEEAVTAEYLLNISPTKEISNYTPHDIRRETKPSVSHLKIFYCISYVLKNSHLHHKFDGKSEKYIFIRYCSQSKAYHVYNPLVAK